MAHYRIYIVDNDGHISQPSKEVDCRDDDAAIDAARVSWLEGTRICVTIIAVMLDKLQQKLVDPEVLADRNALRQEQDNVDYLLSLLPR